MINADEVDLWTRETDELELEIERFLYPPSFQVTVSAFGQQGSFVTVHFTTDRDEWMSSDFRITLPLSDNPQCSKSKIVYSSECM